MPGQKFTTSFTLRFRDADPAQIMYFANVFSFAHDAFEEFIVAAGYQYQEWFTKGDLIIPIRHTEADYRAPFRPGETYEIDATVAQIRENSFQMRYVFRQRDRIHAEVKMVHTCAELKTMRKSPLPEILRTRLAPYAEVTP